MEILVYQYFALNSKRGMFKKGFQYNKYRSFLLISCNFYYIFADDQPVNILLHVSPTFERQEY